MFFDKMFDESTMLMFECNECTGSTFERPPQFLIPPPPRPPSLGGSEYSKLLIQNCNEEELALKAQQQQWDSDMCEAMPILDASLYSSQSLATSAMIAVFSLLLVLVVLISSLFVWKNKRKVQNLLPCKTPTRVPHHMNGALSLGGGGGNTGNGGGMLHHSGAHSVTYEDPDAHHLGHHRPLVMRHHHHHHHHNVEMLHSSKGIHYPSGYPMTRSPPFLVSSSPGPDPYRSNDNVYEELGPGRIGGADSDGESEPPLHSDDDFAEDELSLPGECSFNKAANAATTANAGTDMSGAAVSTIYHERPSAACTLPTTAAGTTIAVTATAASTSTANVASTLPERHSVLSSSSSTAHDASTATAASSSSASNGADNASAVAGMAGGSSTTTAGGLFAGVLRHTTGRSKFSAAQRGRSRQAATASATNDELNTSTSTADIADIAPLYDNRSNMMSLGYLQHAAVQLQQPPHHHPQAYHHSLHHLHHNNNNNNSNNNNSNSSSNNNMMNGARSTAPQFYNTMESEVERRNRINAQLSQAPAPPVATIFRERIHYPGSGRYPQPYYATNSANGLLAATMRARTNPRSMDRRQQHRLIAAPISPIEPAYGYAEPIYNENYYYDTCGVGGMSAPHQHHQQQRTMAAYPTYIMPDYMSTGRMHTGSIASSSSASGYHQPTTQLYARGDSSFGSDSGYSHHTPASSIGRHDYDVTEPLATSNHTQIQQKSTSSTGNKLTAALNFGWNRRKSAANVASSLTATHNSLNLLTNNAATSPNNNTAQIGDQPLLSSNNNTTANAATASSTGASTTPATAQA